MRFASFAVPCALAFGCAPQEGARPSDGSTQGLETLTELEPAFFDTEREYAEEGVAFVRSPFDAPLIRARSCDVVSSQIAALRSLGKRLDPWSDTRIEVEMRLRPSGWCEANVAEVLSPYLHQTLWRRIDDTSVDVNCWGHALRTVNAVPGLTALPAAAFTHVLSSAQCRLLPRAEAPRAGDVVAIRATTSDDSGFVFQEVHGAVWLSEDLWITKNGASRFAVEPPVRILREYVFNPDNPICLERSADVPSRSYLATCQGLVQVFRCEPFDRMMAPAAVRSELRELVGSAAPFVSERLHQQQSSVEVGLLYPGEAYVSPYGYNYVNLAFADLDWDVPRAVKNVLRGLRSDPVFVSEPAPVAGLVPELPGEFERGLRALVADPLSLASGEGFVFLMDWVARKQRVVHDLLVRDATLTPPEKHVLFTILFSLAGSDGRFEGYDTYWTAERLPFSTRVSVAP